MTIRASSCSSFLKQIQMVRIGCRSKNHHWSSSFSCLCVSQPNCQTHHRSQTTAVSTCLSTQPGHRLKKQVWNHCCPKSGQQSTNSRSGNDCLMLPWHIWMSLCHPCLPQGIVRRTLPMGGASRCLFSLTISLNRVSSASSLGTSSGTEIYEDLTGKVVEEQDPANADGTIHTICI